MFHMNIINFSILYNNPKVCPKDKVFSKICAGMQLLITYKFISYSIDIEQTT